MEFVSPGSRRQDFVDKPMRCAEGRVPYFLRVELSRRLGHAQAELFTLGKFGGYDTVARAVSGRRLSADLPFPIDFDPADLLP
ncbi:hypothetical protein ACSNN9_22050 [Micromonospora sp. URMC 107]|uniref:hypothetical protein n=1 Tax=Micromonospora sp. URMC 107 TaxID=3423418 RepID=UPI003F1C6D26